MSKRKHFIGDKFNSWTLIDRFKKDGQTLWKVQCDCGNIYTRKTISNFVNGQSKQCVDCQYASMRSNYDPNKVCDRHYYKLKQSAKKRSINFDILQDSLSKLYQEQNGKCALSGLDINLPDSKEQMDQYNFTASLDRIKSDEIYHIANVQWIHKDINLMKNTLNEDYFINLCKQITKHNE